MSKIKVILFLFVFAVLTSCQKKIEIGIHDIQAPKYYKEYEYRKFWESKGLDFTFSPKHSKQNNLFWKDNISKNFLNINELLNGLLSIEKKERIKWLKEEGFKIKKMTKNYEIYQIKGNNTIFNEILSNYKTRFLIIKDSACFDISYSTFDNDLKKLKDYTNLIDSIENECKKGSIFKTSAKNQLSRKTIDN